jgi:hypothetical protein
MLAAVADDDRRFELTNHLEPPLALAVLSPAKREIPSCQALVSAAALLRPSDLTCPNKFLRTSLSRSTEHFEFLVARSGVLHEECFDLIKHLRRKIFKAVHMLNSNTTFARAGRTPRKCIWLVAEMGSRMRNCAAMAPLQADQKEKAK